MKLVSVWTGILFLVLWCAYPAHASCAAIEPPDQNLLHSDAVFRGEVASIGPSTFLHDVFGWGYPVTFQVLESWKGVDTTTITLAGHHRTSNDVRFDLGQQYLVYAYYEGGDPSKALTTNGCKGTRVVAMAHADLDVLGEGTIALRPAEPESSQPWFLILIIGCLMLVTVSTMYVLRHRVDGA